MREPFLLSAGSSSLESLSSVVSRARDTAGSSPDTSEARGLARGGAGFTGGLVWEPFLVNPGATLFVTFSSALS